MCEPNHSIVQYPPEEPPDRPDDPPTEVTEHRLAWGLPQKLWDLIKKIGGYFHLSKMGTGHHEAIEWASARAHLLPVHTLYEARWWDRTVILDGPFRGIQIPGEDDYALIQATCYAKQVSIGTLTSLRRFLSASMRESNNPIHYVYRFLEHLLTPEGRDHASKALGRMLGLNVATAGVYCLGDKVREHLEQVIKCVLGYTRRRKMLVSPWSDDKTLWNTNPAS